MFHTQVGFIVSRFMHYTTKQLRKPYVSVRSVDQKIKEVDTAAAAILSEASNLFLFNCLQNALAMLVTEIVGSDIHSIPRGPPRNKILQWEGRLRRKIDSVRAK